MAAKLRAWACEGCDRIFYSHVSKPIECQICLSSHTFLYHTRKSSRRRRRNNGYHRLSDEFWLARAKIRHLGKCKECGIEFYRKPRGRRAAALFTKYNIFTSTLSGKLCQSCSDKLRKRFLDGKLAKPRPYTCQTCGAMGISSAAKQLFCPPCYKDREAARHHRKTAIRRSAIEDGELVTKQFLFDRDGGKCGICGKKIDLSVRYPDKRSASIDHIVPLSRGGKHTKANTQLAHFGCNMTKGRKLPQPNHASYMPLFDSPIANAS